eukprot:890615_1
MGCEEYDWLRIWRKYKSKWILVINADVLFNENDNFNVTLMFERFSEWKGARKINTISSWRYNLQVGDVVEITDSFDDKWVVGIVSEIDTKKGVFYATGCGVSAGGK